MRIVVDLQACQTEGSHGRGVGRYSEGLVRALATHPADVDLRLCANGRYGDIVPRIIASLRPAVPAERLTVYNYPPLGRQLPGERTASVEVAEALVRWHWSRMQPDVLHISHAFEGLGGDAVVPNQLPAMPGLVRSATLYDLIPLRFPDWYFADPHLKQWYLEKVGVLRQCDHLLAISNATRTDAIELLGIEPSRITTIWGGVDGSFAPGSTSIDEAARLQRAYGLLDRFVLYTGGDEYRKNLDGALAGFAAIPNDVRRGVQFVLVCAMAADRRRELLRKAEKLGLRSEELVITDFVPQPDLVGLYRLCAAFFFPSLYEGLGLPVLEAMKCGAAVVCSDNSSLREIVDRSDARFDARKPDSMAHVLARALRDAAFREDLRSYGLQRSRQFEWQRTAQLAVDALRDTRQRLRAATPTVAAARLPRRRLAVFTPLPPCRSGVADYNAAFLPWLARHFEIDLYVDGYEVENDALRAQFRIFDHREFASRRTDYDAAIYDLGNSAFHTYILDALARFPGIVVLHDAYLSGLYRYAEFHDGRRGLFSGAMLHSHGPRARRYLAPVQGNPDPAEAATVHLPATKAVLERAIGLISHSPFNSKFARSHYPEGFPAPYRIVPQMISPATLASPEERAAARSALGIANDAFVVCSFGHVAWNKCGGTLLAAFEASALGAHSSARLAFVGEPTRDRFGDELRDAIATSPCSARVAVTGYVDGETYGQYLAACDVAVQLRIQSRGGTPKAVLDCMARGVPVILNDAASYTDYPADVVVKLPATPDAGILAAALDRMHSNPDERARIGRRGREHVARVNDPECVAARYALVVDEYIQRARMGAVDRPVREVAHSIRDRGYTVELVDAAALAIHESLGQSLFPRRRVLVDVSHITTGDHQTGIPRVVKNIVRCLYCSDRAGFEPVAVRLLDGHLVVAQEWLDDQGILLKGERGAGRPQAVVPRRGDCLLMLDSSWARIADFLPLYEAVRRAGGTVHTVVYDMLPIQFPQFMVPGGPQWFRGWLERAVDASDALVCISRAVADALSDFVRERADGAKTEKRIGYWRLGADFAAADRAGTASDRVRLATRGRTLLMVGTIDPRKNHRLVLDAVERLWERGADISLCIAGKPGWMVDELMQRIANHPERGRRLHYVERPTDEELVACYRNCVGLVFPSAGEGFGLPMIEAAQFGKPILASDIPVFREVGGNHVAYVALGTPDALAESLENWLTDIAEGRAPDSSTMPCLTWEQSAEELLGVVLDEPRRAP